MPDRKEWVRIQWVVGPDQESPVTRSTSSETVPVSGIDEYSDQKKLLPTFQTELDNLCLGAGLQSDELQLLERIFMYIYSDRSIQPTQKSFIIATHRYFDQHRSYDPNVRAAAIKIFSQLFH